MFSGDDLSIGRHAPRHQLPKRWSLIGSSLETRMIDMRGLRLFVQLAAELHFARMAARLWRAAHARPKRGTARAHGTTDPPLRGSLELPLDRQLHRHNPRRIGKSVHRTIPGG